MPQILRIATRESPLALWQSEHVAERLRRAHPGLRVELCPMSTRGDQLLSHSLSRVGGKGLFVKELEQAMLDGRADLAVHSMKDMPARHPEGLHLAALLPGEDPRDAFVCPTARDLDALPAGAVVGTASLRRQALLRHHRPDLRVRELRGNVGSRLAKLDAGAFDALLLACAGLRRLSLAERIGQALDLRQFVPAPGQGVIGIQCRIDDEAANAAVRVLDDPWSRTRLGAERALAARLGGACHVPVAAHATLQQGELVLDALVAAPDGTAMVRETARGVPAAAAEIGCALADRLLDGGGREILTALGVAL